MLGSPQELNLTTLHMISSSRATWVPCIFFKPTGSIEFTPRVTARNELKAKVILSSVLASRHKIYQALKRRFLWQIYPVVTHLLPTLVKPAESKPE
jgi:hypothetical protein